MKKKPKNEWKIIKGRVVECIEEDCKERPFAEGLCVQHFDERADFHEEGL